MRETRIPRGNDLDRIISRLRMSVPLLQYAKVDKHLRNLLLATLMKMAVESGETIPTPEGALIHGMTGAEFDKYRATLGGVTGENEDAVSQALKALGIESKVQMVRPRDPAATKAGTGKRRVILSDDEDDEPKGNNAANAVRQMQAAMENLLNLLEGPANNPHNPTNSPIPTLPLYHSTPQNVPES